MQFKFANNLYHAEFQYGDHAATVTVSVLRTRQGADVEEVRVRVPSLADRHFANIHIMYPPEKDPLAKLYAKWDIILCPYITAHLNRVVNRLLERLEVFRHRERKVEHHKTTGGVKRSSEKRRKKSW